MSTTDCVIFPRWVIPVEPQGVALEDHAVVIKNGRIEAITSSDDARQRFPEHLFIDRPEHALLPGFINAHTHAAMSLLRGIADDLPLETWLQEHIWPAEANWVNPEFVRDGTRLAIAEMIRSGTTCFNDMYFFPDEIAATAADAGIRCSVGMIVIDVPTAWANDFDEYLSKGTAVHDTFKEHPLITTVFAPHSPYMVSPEHLAQVATLTNELDTYAHVHVAETADEVERSLSATGKRPLEVLKDAGLLSSQLQAVHMTQLAGGEARELAAVAAHVIHCPESNLKLASGFCPVSELMEAGVNVALGTDGAASNNDLDMLGEMRSAALLAKGLTGNAATLSASDALAMATINGAKALGLAEETGSIEAGKAADLICIDLNHTATQPVYNPISQIVYAANRNQISDVWVAGKALMTDHTLHTVDEDQVIAQAKAWRNRIQDGTEQ